MEVVVVVVVVVVEKLVGIAMTHSEIPCVFSEGVRALVAEAALYLVGQENLFE
jgi:hypothetical protein